MKHIISLILLTAILLCGCGTTAQEPITAEELQLVITDGVAENLYDWNRFYWDTCFDITCSNCSIRIDRQQGEETDEAILEYDGTAYTITDSRGSRTYSHLIHSTYSGIPGIPSDTYTECFLLSDDPEMTYWTYISAALSSSSAAFNEIQSTEIVYCEYRTFPRAESYGNAPSQLSFFIQSLTSAQRIWYRADSCFLAEQLDSRTHSADRITRYSWNGGSHTQTQVDGIVSDICELEDGGFLVSSESYADQLYLLTCFDADGSQRWQYRFRDDFVINTVNIFQQGVDIFLFSDRHPEDGSTDLYLCRFSPEGNLLQEATFGGSDFDSIDRVQPLDSGFRLYGHSQSNDGDFPLSEDGYPADFTALITEDLHMEVLDLSEHEYASEAGYHNGSLLYSDDPLLTVVPEDNLPEDITGVQIFDWEDGYVIVRAHRLGDYPFSYPMMSYQPSYTELIFTGYSPEGTPLWQTISNIFSA